MIVKNVRRALAGGKSPPDVRIETLKEAPIEVLCKTARGQALATRPARKKLGQPRQGGIGRCRRAGRTLGFACTRNSGGNTAGQDGAEAPPGWLHHSDPVYIWEGVLTRS
jgi:hypothetical protein